MAECEGLALMTLTRIEKMIKLVKGASEGCNMWYQSKVLFFKLEL